MEIQADRALLVDYLFPGHHIDRQPINRERLIMFFYFFYFFFGGEGWLICYIQ